MQGKTIVGWTAWMTPGRPSIKEYTLSFYMNLVEHQTAMENFHLLFEDWNIFNRGIYVRHAGFLAWQNLELVLTPPLLRYPRLTVFAMEYGSDISSLQSQTVHTVMKEYFTFPILMSDKDFTHVRHITSKS